MKKDFRKDGSGNYPELYWGQEIYLFPAYGKGKKYFVCNLSKGLCLIADSKKDMKEERGYIYNISCINKYVTE